MSDEPSSLDQILKEKAILTDSTIRIAPFCMENQGILYYVSLIWNITQLHIYRIYMILLI